jgi:hypothetical protein
MLIGLDGWRAGYQDLRIGVWRLLYHAKDLVYDSNDMFAYPFSNLKLEVAVQIHAFRNLGILAALHGKKEALHNTNKRNVVRSLTGHSGDYKNDANESARKSR